MELIQPPPQVQQAEELLVIRILVPTEGGQLMQKIWANHRLAQDHTALRAAVLGIVSAAVDFLRQVEAGQAGPPIVIPPPGLLRN